MKRFFAAFFAVVFCAGSLMAQRLKVQLTEHAANVETIVYSPDGKYFASSGWDGLVNLYTLDSIGIPKFRKSFSGHLGAVTSLWFSANSKWLVSCGKDYSARIWNIDFPDSSRVYNMHFEPVTNAFLDPGGKVLITSSTDGTIKVTSIYDVKKSKTITIGKSVTDMVLSADNKFYYVAAKGGNILKVETASAKISEEQLTGHKDEVNALDISPDGNYLASGSSDKTIILWDLSTGKELKKLSGFEWKVTSVEYSRDGRYIVGGCNDGTVKLFNTETGALITDFTEVGRNVRDVAFSQDQMQIAVATNLESEKNGAVIYNSMVVYVKPEPVVKPKPTKPVTKTQNKTAPAKK